ncbi:MAG: hypothetical protein KDK05_03445 [Candidatus Competibacteraceae bacterium]|nr:hypothetical protein [Candidatus Competibacteraceae bacterium]
MRKEFFTSAVLALSLAPNVQAQQAESDSTTPPVLEWTCNDVMGHYADARAEDGVSAEELEQARVFAMEITLWINGYLTGKHGLDLEQKPFGAEGLERTIELVAETCESAPDARFLDVLKKL